MMETTRRFPRTMGEAFPQEAHWIEVYRRPSRGLGVIGWMAACLGTSAFIGWLLYTGI